MKSNAYRMHTPGALLRHGLVLAQVLCLLVVSSPHAWGDEAGEIVVTVTGTDDEALKDIQVVVWNAETVLRGVTDAEGRWRKEAPAGSYSVALRGHARVGTEQYEVEIEAGEVTELSFEMIPGVQFIGRVLDAAGKPVVGADVVVENGGSFKGMMERTFGVPPYARDRTREDGRFYVGGIPDGKIATIIVSKKGLQTRRMGVRAVDGSMQPDPVVVKMREGASVSGRVTHPDGTPAKGVSVYVIPTAYPRLLATPTMWMTSNQGEEIRALDGTTDDDGRYRIEGAEFGSEYLVKVMAEGFALSAAAKPVTPTADAPRVVSDVVLSRGRTLSVRLVAPDGTSVRAATVKVGSAMNAPKLEKANEDGLFVFHHLTAGETFVAVEAKGFLDQIKPLTIEADKDADVRVELDLGARIRGVVRTADGKPVAGVDVTTSFKTPNPATGWTRYDSRDAETDAEGRFDLGPLRPGTYELQLSSSSWALVKKPKIKAPSEEDVVLTARPLGRAVMRFLRPDGTPFEGRAMIWRDTPSVSGTRSGSEKTFEGGRYEVKALGPTPIRVSFEFEDYVRVERTLASADGTLQDLGDIRLETGVTVRGVVRLPSGEPAVEARLRWGDDWSYTDEEGRFELEHMRVGPLVFTVNADELPKMFFALEVKEGLPEQQLQLVAGVLVRVRILDAEGQPVPSGRVILDHRIEDTWHWWGSGRADETGGFEGRLAPGRWRMTTPAPKGGGAPTTLLEFTLEEGTERELTVRLPKKG